MSRGERWALLVLAAVLALELAFLASGLDDLDEGYFAEQATRVLRGEIPYRDFDSLYTPGALYLHAIAFWIAGGPEVLALRVVGWLARVAGAASLYLLGRSVARPRFAVLAPLLLVLATDEAPEHWRPHPGWHTVYLSALTVWALGRAREAGTERARAVWLVATGVGIGATFLFKQNAGIFLALACGSAVLLLGVGARPGSTSEPADAGALGTGRAAPGAPARPERGAVTRRMLRSAQHDNAAHRAGLATYAGQARAWVRALQATVAVLGWAAVAWLVRPFFSVSIGLYLLLPLAAATALALRWAWQRGASPFGPPLWPLVPLAGGFALATLPWLVPLVVALGGRVSLLGSFVGVTTNQAILFWPIEPPGPAGSLGLVLAGTAVGGCLAKCFTMRLVAVLAAVVAVGLGVWVTGERGEAPLLALLAFPARVGAGFIVLLPVVAILGASVLAWRVRDAEPHAWRLRWYLLAAAWTFLTQYPRLDVTHLAWSAGIPFVVGAIALDRAERWLVARGRLTTRRAAALYPALLVVPLLAAMPTLAWRGSPFMVANNEVGSFLAVPQRQVAGIPALEGVWAPARSVDDVERTVAEIRARTAPGEPIFVYPSSPLLYVAADRPNPTRFAHLYPGAATPAELAEVQRILAETPVRLVVISDFWLRAWSEEAVLSGARTSLPEENRGLEAFLAAAYREVARVGAYRILELSR